MNKKKLLTMVLALVLIGAVGVGATLAYFTDKAEVNNVVTMGHVDITLTENEVEVNENGDYVQKESETETGIRFENLMPGMILPKNPTVTLGEKSLDALVRVKVNINGLFKAEAKGEPVANIKQNILDDIKAQAATNGWTYNETDQYFYYNSPLTKTEREAVLFTTVTIPTAWNNNFAEDSFEIQVFAEAIQADNLENGFNKLSWNMTTEQILKYEPTPAAGTGENAGETTQP